MSVSPDSQSKRNQERRRACRIEVRGRFGAQLISRQTGPITLVDFSSGGLSITSPQPLTRGAVHQFQIGDEAPSILTATVAHCRRVPTNSPETAYLVGFRFLSLTTTQRALVNRLLDQLVETLTFD